MTRARLMTKKPKTIEDTWVYQMAKLREALHDLKEAIIDEFCRVTRMHR